MLYFLQSPITSAS